MRLGTVSLLILATFLAHHIDLYAQSIYAYKSYEVSSISNANLDERPRGAIFLGGIRGTGNFRSFFDQSTSIDFVGGKIDGFTHVNSFYGRFLGEILVFLPDDFEDPTNLQTNLEAELLTYPVRFQSSSLGLGFQAEYSQLMFDSLLVLDQEEMRDVIGVSGLVSLSTNLERITNAVLVGGVKYQIINLGEDSPLPRQLAAWHVGVRVSSFFERFGVHLRADYLEFLWGGTNSTQQETGTYLDLSQWNVSAKLSASFIRWGLYAEVHSNAFYELINLQNLSGEQRNLDRKLKETGITLGIILVLR